MPRPASDRALRALAADLSALDPQDVDAVLSRLTAPQKRAMIALMDEAQGRPAHVASLGEEMTGLSPWLAARVSQNPGVDPFALRREAFAMTPQATETLRTLTRSLLTQAPPATPRPSRRISGLPDLFAGRSRRP